MATYTLTTGTDTISASGTNTILGTAATITPGDSLGVPGSSYELLISGGGAVDLRNLHNGAARLMVRVDDAPTQLTMNDPGGIAVHLGNGADTVLGGSGGFAVAYSSQSQLDGDHITGSSSQFDTLQTSVSLDLTHIAQLSRVESLMAVGASSTLIVDDRVLAGIKRVSAQNTLTLRADTGSLDLADKEFGVFIGGATRYELVGTHESGTVFTLPTSNSENLLRYLTRIEGHGLEDVVATSNGTILAGRTLVGIETLRVSGSVALDQANVDAIDHIRGMANSFASITVAGSSIDFSDIELSNVRVQASLANAAAITGSAGADTIIGGWGSDTLAGGTGADDLSGNEGMDVLAGGDGADTISGGGGADILTGGDGADVFSGSLSTLNGDRIRDFSADDRIVIGGGVDASRATVSYADGVLTIDPDGAGSQAGIQVLLDGSYTGAFSVRQVGGSAVISYEAPTAPTPQDDNLTGTAGVDVIDALAGNDTVLGLGGNDTLTGSNGDDSIRGGDGNDSVTGLNDDDTVHGDAGDDWVRGGRGDDYVDGGAGVDAIWGDPGADTLVGGDGADRFFFIAGYGDDRILDFDAAEGDRIRLDKALGVASIADGADGNAVVTTSDGGTMTLVGHRAADVQSGWIGL